MLKVIVKFVKILVSFDVKINSAVYNLKKNQRLLKLLVYFIWKTFPLAVNLFQTLPRKT